MASLPSSLKGAFFGTLALAMLFGCCGLYSGVGVIAQLLFERELGVDLAAVSQMGHASELYRIGRIVAIVDLGLQLVVAFALAVGGAIGLTGKPVGRALALGALALSAVIVVVQLATGVWMWSQTQALMSSLGDGMVGEDARVVGAFGLLALAPSVCWHVVRLAVAGGCAAAMLTPESRAFYERVGPGGLRGGPRE